MMWPLGEIGVSCVRYHGRDLWVSETFSESFFFCHFFKKRPSDP